MKLSEIESISIHSIQLRVSILSSDSEFMDGHMFECARMDNWILVKCVSYFWLYYNCCQGRVMLLRPSQDLVEIHPDSAGLSWRPAALHFLQAPTALDRGGLWSTLRRHPLSALPRPCTSQKLVQEAGSSWDRREWEREQGTTSKRVTQPLKTWQRLVRAR